MNSFLRTLSHTVLAAILLSPCVHAFTAEQWLALPANPAVLTLQREGIAKRSPNSTSTLTTASISPLASGTGVRLRGTITPTVTGSYSLAISGSNNSTLWLSSSSSRFQKQRIAWHYEPTTSQQWTKFTSQQSAAITLTAGTSYYIEAQAMSNSASGQLSLGWKTPGSASITLIPATVIAPLAADPNDLNNNNLPDDWETLTGLVNVTTFTGRSEYGDPDADGITNNDEYLLGSSPLTLEFRPNGITRDTWSEIQGQSTAHLTAARSRFLSHPTTTAHVPNIDETSPNKIEGKNYGARYRGFLIAPTTGSYRLWIAGDDDAELWFADGSVLDPSSATSLPNRFGKQLLAHAHDTFSKSYRDFDLAPTQRSRSVQLTAGQAYYIEVLHKNESIATNHITVAWEIPGQAREIIPTSAFQGDVPLATDADADSLPDSWEIAKGLSITDNGFTDAKQGQYGDFDADGLNNLLEFQLGTNPKSADTDGDTLSDSAELNYYRTNPLIANVIATTLHSTLPLSSPVATSFPWKTNANGSISSYERRGWLDWTITIAPGQAGIYEIRLLGDASGLTIDIPLSFYLNGNLIDRQKMICKSNQVTTVKQITPFLTTGTHTLRIQSHNNRADVALRFNSLTLYRLGGTDANSNNIADWAEAQFQAQNRLITLPTSSLTSPAYIEGVTNNLSALSLSYNLPGNAATPLPPELSIDDGFFANIPLSPTQDTQLNYSFLNGAQPQTQPITWTATNILAQSSIKIRQGDSLRITAHDPSATPSGTFTLTSSTLTLSTEAQNTQSSASPVILTFDQPGTHTITAVWTPVDGAPQTATLTLTVHSANFGPTFVLETYNRRTWNITTVSGVDIEADATLYWRETTASPSAPTRSFLANSFYAGETRVIARIPSTRQIIAVGKISSFSLARAGESADAQTVLLRPDGSKVIRFTIVGENLPANIEIRLRLNYQGSTFPDGSRDLVLRRSDFSSNGIADILVETSSNPPQLCHSMTAFLVD